MAKRFTDNQKWSKSWFMDLTLEEKLLWIYMTDSCDHAGIWEVNWKLTSFMVGFQVTQLPKAFDKQVEAIKDNKYLDSHTIFDDTYTDRAIDLLKNYQTDNQDTEWDPNDY